jgi:methylenetetrahydrofolate dehydrogenase (NADP+)/methenyltetrahydrofolate cyclohydrolase
MTIIDGKKIAEEIQEELRKKILDLKKRRPALAVIQVGKYPASSIYVKRKVEACKKVGIESILAPLPETISENEVLSQIETFNQNPKIDGILLQLPLPTRINPLKMNEAISPLKDVDGFHPINMGRLLMGEPGGFVPCTPLGVRRLLTLSGIEITGKHVVIIGRSLIVGKPLAALFMQNSPEGNATVTVIHSQSKNIQPICKSADIVIAALGSPHFVTRDLVAEKAVVIDVGINRIEDPAEPHKYRLTGDADFENLKDYCAAITPVPGGVGPMTIAMLLSNTFDSYQKRASVCL